MQNSPVKVRFAPSPTGHLHVGGLRTALFNYLFARNQGGEFLLRIEDTDQARKVEGTDKEIIETLKLFGLVPDNLEANTLPEKFYQSSRLKLYQKHADELIQKGAAYKCYCGEERIQELKDQAKLDKRAYKYDKHCLNNPPEGGGEFVVRQNVPEQGSIEFDDLVYGKIKIENQYLDDSVLMKSDGFPTYNFANVIDDHDMGITHVLRGEEFVPSTPKHILLYQQFGWDVPEFAHVPLILDRHKKKLSKRTGKIAVTDYLDQGYLKEAVLNFIALLGWNPKSTREIFSLDELASEFDIKKINKAGAVFDTDKLNHINSEWIKKIGAGEILKQRIEDGLNVKEGQAGWVENNILPMILERIKGPDHLDEALPEFGFFFNEPEYDAALLVWKDADKQTLKDNLQKLHDFLEEAELGEWDLAQTESAIMDFIKQQGMNTGEALWPLRVALSGLKNSPGPFEIIHAFTRQEAGKAVVLGRIRTAIEKL